MYKTSFPNVFEASTVETMKSRINQLSADTKPQWGVMNAGQMLAHLNVAYDIAYGKIPMKYNFFMRFMFKQFLVPIVIGDKPYAKNSQTAPVFKIEDERDFDVEKAKLIGYIERMQREGSDKFEGKESSSFGKLTSEQWSRQFAKHFEHHFTRNLVFKLNAESQRTLSVFIHQLNQSQVMNLIKQSAIRFKIE